MDTLLEDYDDIENYVPLNNTERCEDNSRDEQFPELWEIEMEVLQVENSFDTGINVEKSFISHNNQVMLDDYVDSEEEGEREFALEECNNQTETFPTMWELELEILHSEQSTIQENSAERLKSSDLSQPEMPGAYLCNTSICNSTMSPALKIRNNSFSGNEDLREAKSMLEQLNISSGNGEIQPHLKGDVQNIFANLNIA